MKYLLSIDCANSNLSVAVYADGQFYSYHQEVRQGHSDLALTIIGQLLSESGLQLDQLDAVIFGKGPGAFTGLRIAAGISIGLGLAANLPVYGIPTLDAIASSLPQQTGIALMDARMGEFYHARYESGVRQGDIQVSPPATISEMLTNGGAYAGDTELPTQEHPVSFTYAQPNAVTYLRLFLSTPDRYQQPDGNDLLYIRNKVALTAAEQLEKKRA